ncbi:Uncharacterized phage protein gp47/JayE [Peptoniphilus asaccharolyticus DSM 20463]|uniref:Uncharacterized phage protein gp47/JayE n=1 Tax=Peptoniphilus asaccharolyticus DSM 20463 TaxID=573058 RepID=A0A1W1V151_PEPAS|nr:baseplate J/gp47 family protein [Peptoniphilus asaccharolyticus]MBL7575511.1 baseplate J/gp47 family protein [Peptoniphilus asaccharolyticus]SMB87077.1 Uncharacterized phage protein gp47/JayE [Peptoniphilus asaccharolyticus DSM 20463]
MAQMEYNAQFDEFSADFLLNRMLSRVDNSRDKREGSIIYDAMAPGSIELSLIYMELDYILKNMFGDTADRTSLIAIARDRALKPFPSTQAIVKGEFDIKLPINARFNFDNINFMATNFLEERSGKFYYELVCEEYGEVGNIPHGKLIPIDTIRNLKHAYIVSVIKPGEEEEDTEDFRERYFRHIKTNAYGGNIDQYLDWCHAIEGVGGVKVYPVWNGGGTVKIVFTDSKFNSPSRELIGKVQELLDPVAHHQLGYGLAPIGHLVTVGGANKKELNLSLKLTLRDDVLSDGISEKIKSALEPYFLQLRKEWEKEKSTIVRISKLESLILDVDGVIDVLDTKLNEYERNGILGEAEIPFLNAVIVNGG